MSSESTGKWFVRVTAGLVGVAAWIWFWHGLSAVPESFKTLTIYFVGSIVVFSIVGWLVGGVYTVITRDS